MKGRGDGIGQPIGEIAEIFGKAKVQGRLFMEDINQLTGRGIPIIGELAKQFGVAESGVRGLVESGKVSFGNLETAFASLTNDGGKFSGMMQAQSGTLSGMWSTLSDNVKMTLADLGGEVIKAFNFKGLMQTAIGLTDSIRSGFESVRPVVQETGAVISATLDFVVGGWRSLFSEIASSSGLTFGSVRETVLEAMIGAEFGIKNFGDIALFAFKSATAEALGFAGELEHFFTGTIPAVLNWFGSNWHDIWFTAVDAGLTMLMNFGENVRHLMGELWDFIATGGVDKLELSWKPLTDGFVSTIKSLPDIPPRVVGDLEKSIRADVKSLGTGLTKDFAEFRSKRLAALGGGPDKLPESFSGKKAAAALGMEGGAADGLGGGPGGKGGDKGKPFASPIELGTQEAFARIAELTMGSAPSTGGLAGQAGAAANAAGVAAKASQQLPQGGVIGAAQAGGGNSEQRWFDLGNRILGALLDLKRDQLRRGDLKVAKL